MSDQMSVSKIRGIKAPVTKKLQAKSIGNSLQLLDAGKTAKSRDALAKELGVSASTVLELVNRADLARIKGIGEVYSNMLEVAGVDTVKELAQRKPDNLVTTLSDVNTKKKLTKQTPTLEQVKDWVSQAKALKKIVTY